METENGLIAARGKKGEGVVEKGEGTSQQTCMNDPWPWTTVWELTVGDRGRLGVGGQKGKNWDNCKRINKNKNKN